MTAERVDLNGLDTGERLAQFIAVRNQAYDLKGLAGTVRIGYRNRHKHRVFIDARLVTVAQISGYNRPLYAVVRRFGDTYDILIDVHDLLSFEVLK